MDDVRALTNAKPFPGPRAALVWHFWKCYKAHVLLGAAGAFWIGLVAGFNAARDDPGIENSWVLIFPLTILLAELHRIGAKSETLGVFDRLPISTRLFVLLGFGFFVGGFTLVALAFGAGYAWAGHGWQSVQLDAFALLAALGALAQTWYWAMRGPAPATWRVAPYFVLSALVLAAAYGGLFQLLNGAVLWVLCAAAGSLGLALSFRLADRARHRAGEALELPVSERAQKDVLPHVVAAPNRRPFASPTTAQAWYTGREVLEQVLHPNLIRVFMFIMLFLYPLSTHRTLPGPGIAIDATCAFSAFLYFIYIYEKPGAMGLQLPFSAWSHGTAYLRFAGTALAVLALLFVAATSTAALFGGDVGTTDPLAVLGILSLALWCGWIATTLYIGILMAAIPMFLRPDMNPEFTGAIACWLWLALHAASGSRLAAEWNNQKMRQWLSDGATTAALIAVLAGIIYLPDSPLPPWGHWITREGLGASLLLALIHGAVQGQFIPPATGWKLAGGLVTGATLSCAGAALLQPSIIAVDGIAGAFLAFGVLPPLFIPLLMFPMYLAAPRDVTLTRHVK